MNRRLACGALLALSLTACGSRADFSALKADDGSGQPVSTTGGQPVTNGTTGAVTTPAGTTGGTTTGTTGALGGTTGTSGTSGGTGSTGTTGVVSGGTSGVLQPTNKAPIRLAYIIQGSAGVSALTGSNVGSSNGNVAVRTMNALVAWANAHGGVGGRKISAQGFNSEATSQESDRLALCKQITEDYKAQVLIDQNQYLAEDGWSCFAEHHVDYLGTVTATDRSFFKKYKPYVTTTWLAEDRSITAMVNGGQAAGFFKGGTVGIIMTDNPTQHRLYDTQLKPELARVGVTNPQVRFITESTSSFTAQTNAAELAFATAGVNRVVFLENILVYLAFTNQAQSQGYHPRYEFSDFEDMGGVSAFYGNSAQNAGALAVSSSPEAVLEDDSQSSTDTTKPYDRKKMTPGQVRCLDLLTKQTGVNYYDPTASGDSLATWNWFCDEFFAWFEGAQAVGASWTPALLDQGLATVKSYLSTNQHTASFAGGVNDGATSYRVGQYNSTCKCYVKITGWLPI